ncbi:gustatory receptor for sugar taste 64a-like [Choristoneura fumiferana]|uniref:gustatory receptor for sugar taste 64a-like n=1 Tax=Choristoneura fumiferana TaxID=7141 RepID=UPI003D159954
MKSMHQCPKDEFLCTIAVIFNAARWLGVPKRGGNTAMCLSVVILFMLLGLEFTAIWKLIRAFGGWAVVKGSTTARLSGAIFYGNALFSHLLSWKFISSWEDLSLHWTKIEIAEVIRLPQDVQIKKRMTIVTCFVATCALLEHVLSMMAATGLNCPPAEYFQQYILSSHGFLIHKWEYNLWIAVPIFFLSKVATILWNFQDLMIILISMGLTSRYHRLNSCVKRVIKSEKRKGKQGKFGTEKYAEVQTWRRLREAYVRQAELVRRVDGNLGALILLSNLNNLYFICLQLFLGINNEQGPPINRIYYFLSLSWLIFRACSVVLVAADIHTHSRSALPLLHACPCNVYNVEISRLKTQLTYDFVAIKGMGLFALDRKLLLEVAAVILKYELVLIQFDK